MTPNFASQRFMIVIVFGANMNGLIMHFRVMIVEVSREMSSDTKMIDLLRITADQMWRSVSRGRL